MHKLGIIVPYRDRYDQLHTFLDRISKYCDKKRYKYTVIVVEQDNASAFNRGMLCNIGFKEAVKQKCDYVVFHDVDMLPIDVDYSYAEHPVHLATDNLPFDSYFGGITLFPVEDFKKIDGFSNLYWGWGFEDDDLMYRCIRQGIKLGSDEMEFKNRNRVALMLNGHNSFVTLDNTLNTQKSFTVGITVRGDKLTLDHKKPSDIFPLVNIQGYDFNLAYSSFKRFAFQFFDAKNNFHQIYSDIQENKESFIVVTYHKPKGLIRMYINGELVGEQKIDSNFYNYNKVKTIFLGADHTQTNYYKGAIDNFFIFDKALERSEIKAIYDSPEYNLTSDFYTYESSENLVTYYDSRLIRKYKLIDLASGKTPGEIVKGYQSKLMTDKKYHIYTPLRRKSKIQKLTHEENGFVGGRWKSDLTRWNELRYTNEVQNGSYDSVADGLSTCEFTQHSRVKQDNYIHLNVGI